MKEEQDVQKLKEATHATDVTIKYMYVPPILIFYNI